MNLFSLSGLSKFLFFGILAVFITSTGNAQYSPFYSLERKLKEYSSYSSYQEVINTFNQDKDFEKAIDELDRLADLSLKNEEYNQYLFFKNEVANFYKSSNGNDVGFSELVKAMEIYSMNEDTINIEYAVSYRLLRGLGKRTTHKTIDEGKLLSSQLEIINMLGISGQALTNTYVDYGLFLSREGKTDESFEMLYQARKSALESDDISSLAVSDYTLITNISMNFDLRQSVLDVLKNDLELLNEAEPSIPVLAYSAYFNYILGERYYSYFQDVENSVKYAKEAIAILEDLSYPIWNLMASCHSSLALLNAQMQDTTQLWKHYLQAKNIADNQSMSDYNKSLAYVNIAEAALEVSPDSVFVLLEEIKLQPGAENFKEKIVELEAKALIDKGDYQTAFKVIADQFQQHQIIEGNRIPIPSEDMDPLYQIEFFSIMDKAFRELEGQTGEDNGEEIRVLIAGQNKLYIKLMEQDVFGHELSGLQEKYHDFVMPSLGYLFASDNPEEDQKQILDLIFSSKTIQLTNNMTKSRHIASLEKSHLFSRISEIVSEMQELRNALAQNNEPEDERKMKRQLNNLLIENLMLRYSIQKEQKYDFQRVMIPSAGQLQGKIAENQAIIEYCINDSLLMFAFITADGIKTGYSYVENLQDIISRELYTIKTGGRESALGSLLFHNIGDELQSVDHLIVIPDKHLNRIPFEWLISPASGRMIIEDMCVSYSYSTSLWYLLNERDPEQADRNILAVAPFVTSYETQFAKNTNRYPGAGNESLAPLPQSKEEVENIKNIFSAKAKVECLTGKNATELNLVNQLPSATIIHFATHAHVDNENPEYSGLYLFNESGSRYSNEDNFLSLGELMNHNINADLAVLSACDTGRGDFVRGEGIIALPRGFIFAGIPNVIASLWKVHDERTRDLMTSFYHYLAQGESYYEALRHAKLDSIKKGILPLDWAGFILLGR